MLFQAVKLPDFYALFYPEFYENKTDSQPFLIPDGALVLKRDSQAKLVFLEIEKKKPDWEKHLEGKRWKYEKIAEREETCSIWWRHWCNLLKLNQCSFNEFGFVVLCIGELKEDWHGWEFKKAI